jgi:hypothetical protein
LEQPAEENFFGPLRLKNRIPCELHARSGDMHELHDSAERGELISFFQKVFHSYQICTFYRDAEQTGHGMFYRAAKKLECDYAS